ncbi:MAG: L,D-transpeptidase [Rhodobacteraceae bacterium]|nr:L,D-transpeptidase [Paracoccaceae bacterium]
MRALFPAALKTFLAIGFVALLSACVTEGGMPVPKAKPGEPKLVENAYLATKDANIDIPALPVEEIPQEYRRQSVYFETAEAPGTIIINPSQRVLHYVTGKNQAIRYGISVGRAGFEWAGTAIVSEKKPWPTWTPPAEMIARDPKLAKWKDGQPGGPTNPLGARAIYLTTNGVDYGYRIHGTPEWRSIGRNASSGCIRMINQDVIDLYNRIQGGEKVVVLTRDGQYPTRLILPPPQPVKKVAPVVVPAAIPSFNPLLQGVPPSLQAPAVTTPTTTAPATTTTTITTTSGG